MGYTNGRKFDWSGHFLPPSSRGWGQGGLERQEASLFGQRPEGIRG